jgi:putative transposase
MKPSPHRYVYQLVRAKRATEGPAAPAEAALETAIGSRGWHTRGYLPHFDKPGVVQMVTFRLADAMPAARRRDWACLFTIEDESERQTKLEAYLDEGYGECLLRDARLARVVEEVLLFRDSQDYRLAAWVVMPNHVHVVFEQWLVPLGEVVKTWKGVSSWALNQVLGRTGDRWQGDYWDRFMRDEAHFRKAEHYIEWNPVKAGLVKEPQMWPFSSLNPQWVWSGADRYRNGHLLNKPDEWIAQRLKAIQRRRRKPEANMDRSANTLVRPPTLGQARRTRVSALLLPDHGATFDK